ncbi:MAG: hypothetical protein OWR62_14300 [Sulfobacillus thermotolerans]|nr:hypothetical protein [Sulfobacillus thermotolerans]
MIQPSIERPRFWVDTRLAFERAIQIMTTHVDPRGIWNFYEAKGYKVNTLGDIASVPYTLREYRVTLLRGRYRAYILGEMGISQLAGPLSPAVGIPILAWILLLWGVQMGWAYAVDMRDPAVQAMLASIIAEDLERVVFGRPGCRRWRGTTVLRLFLLGWGQELAWADEVMAHVRRVFRRTRLSI